MKISTLSTICISIAENPGNFGASFHNSAYSLLNLNWLYIPRKVVTNNDLKRAIEGVRTFNIRGCSVSMPHKENVIEFIDNLDISADKIGAVNTIVNTNGLLKGYNTDFYGAKRALEKHSLKGKKVIMIGAGGVAKAIGLAVIEIGGELTIINRDNQKALKLASKLKCETKEYKHINESQGYCLINATSVGMNDDKKMVVNDNVLNNFETIMDVVIYPKETKLIKSALLMKKNIIPGSKMCVYQAAEQFKLYTGKNVPNQLIVNKIKLL